MNESNKTLSSDDAVELLILPLLTFVIALWGLIGNTVVIWLLGFRLRRNSFSVYILNLAVSDFLFLSNLILMFIVTILVLFNPIFTFALQCFSATFLVLYILSLSILSAISTERCLSVLCPIWYRCHRPRNLSVVTCVLLWALSLFLVILEEIYCTLIVHLDNDGWCQVTEFVIASWLIFLFVTLFGSSFTLLVKMCGSQRKKLTRLFVTVVLSVLVFFLCGLPLGIYHLLLSRIQEHSNKVASAWSILLSCINSSSNPIIYFLVGSFRHRLGRRNLKVFFQRALEDTPEVEESGGSLSQETMEMYQSSVAS
ncbi:PREDICTED: mas-related G-protein coupled receptor member X3-like [Elephantulus edwardii]|uniref:mas-related G-protein coupled receptor member X3-like n=1 Tax=Elephantulus edwardii TaxID=28737 RepID=UPI0003F083A9|nr:PREDICTED: mas-related G-protein coupled receptor member X3-like [Elephantulus edwardii]